MCTIAVAKVAVAAQIPGLVQKTGQIADFFLKICQIPKQEREKRTCPWKPGRVVILNVVDW